MLGATLIASLTGAACGAARAEVELAPLAVPEPPPRVVPVVDSSTTPPPDATPTDTGVREPPRESPRAREPRPPSPAAEPSPAAPSAQAPDVPPARLRSGSTREGPAFTAEVRALLTRATRSLTAIDRRRLSAADRTQYDTAQRFIEQAEAALERDNLVFARYLADKGASLAGQLEGR